MMMNKKILSLDFSLNGSAIWIGDGTPKNTKYYYFSPLKGDIKNTNCIPIEDGLNSTEKLDNVICFFLSKINDIDLVVLESASFSSSNSNTDFKAGYHIITYLCRRLNIECIQIPPITNKMFFTDNAKATKDEMVKQLEKYTNFIDLNDVSKKKREDLADAFSLYMIGYEYLLCTRLPAPKGCLGTQDVKFYDTLPLNDKMVIAKLYNREDLYKEAKKQREKNKKHNT